MSARRFEQDLPLSDEDLELIAEGIEAHLRTTGKTLVEFTAEYEARLIQTGKRDFGDPKTQRWFDQMYDGAAEVDVQAGRKAGRFGTNA